MSEKVLKAKLRFVMPPTAAQAAKFKDFIAAKYGTDKNDVELELINDPEVLGGFILCVGEDEYDWSLKGRAKEIRAAADREMVLRPGSGDVISVIKDVTA